MYILSFDFVIINMNKHKQETDKENVTLQMTDVNHFYINTILQSCCLQIQLQECVW